MTLSIFCALHLAYGAGCAYISKKRLLFDGDVIGWPMVTMLSPVALISLPITVLLSRYHTDWFFSGIDLSRFDAALSRYFLPIAIGIGLSATVLTLVGNFFTIFFITRDIPNFGIAPIVVSACLAIFAVLTTWSMGTLSATLSSLAVLFCLVAALLFLKARLSAPPEN